MRLCKIEAKLGVESESGEATFETEGFENVTDNRADETKTTVDTERRKTNMKQEDSGFEKGGEDENVKDMGINELNDMKESYEEDEEEAAEVDTDTGTEKQLWKV